MSAGVVSHVVCVAVSRAAGAGRHVAGYEDGVEPSAAAHRLLFEPLPHSG